MPNQKSKPKPPDSLPPPWRDNGDFGVCPDCDHKGEYYNGLPYVCEDSGVVVDDNEKCSAPDCKCTATRPQCPKCGAGMWYATTQAEYETGWPEPTASQIWHNVKVHTPLPARATVETEVKP